MVFPNRPRNVPSETLSFPVPSSPETDMLLISSISLLIGIMFTFDVTSLALWGVATIFKDDTRLLLA